MKALSSHSISTLLLYTTLLSLLTIVPLAIGQNSADVVGVKTGDWVKYRVTKIGSNIAWDIPGAVWIRIEVSDVTGTTVTVRETIHYDDGDEGVKNFSWNLQHYDNPSILYIIAVNLEPGDKIDEIPMEVEINKWEYVDLTLNDTSYRSYGGMTREVNQLKWSQIRPHFWNKANYTYEQYWDKSTGFLLEAKWQGYLLGFEEYYETHPPSIYKLEIEDTNLFEMQKTQLLSLWILAIPIGATIVAASITVKLHHNRKNRKAS